MSTFDPERDLAREDLCRFLAACYYEPGPELSDERVFEAMTRAASRVASALVPHAQALESAFVSAGSERLLPDYARLFMGPPSPLAAPYASVWLDDDHKVMGESTYKALALYSELGFALDDGFRDAPDHIAVELEFLYLVLFRENEARRADDAEAVRRVRDIKRRFVDDHLALWVEPFASAMKSDSQCDFYRELASLTERFVRGERSGAATS